MLAGRFMALLLLILLAPPVPAREPGGFRELDLPGPFRVDLRRVIDGWRFDLRWLEGPSPPRNSHFHLGDVHTPSATSTDQACERAIGIATRDFVRSYLRGKRIRIRNVRQGRHRNTRVGQLQAEGEDLSALLLDMGLAIPYHESPRNSALRRWDCSGNEKARASLEAAGIRVGPEAGD